MDGYEMVKRIRANPQTRFIPVIIQTAKGEAQDARRGSQVGAMGYITDPTDLDLLLARARTLLDFKNYLDSCEEAAFTDHLTGLANRRRFERQLEREVARATRFGHPFCLLLLEIDKFQKLNEEYGRTIVGEALRRLGQTIMGLTRPEIDTCARFDSDLLSILLPEANRERAIELMGRLQIAFKDIELSGAKEGLVVNIGIAAFPVDAQDGRGLFDFADAALSKATRSRKAAFDVAMTWVQDYLQGRTTTSNPPTCFISYAWDTPQHEKWVAALAKDLNKAGIETVLDRRDNAAIGSNIARFVSRIETCDYIIVIGTPRYKEKYENRDSKSGYVVAAEVDLINTRLLGTENEKNTILPILREGAPKTALPPSMWGRVCCAFQSEETYFINLFDLILTLHGIPFANPDVENLRESLRIDD
jgi:diguanylate cyclase (GGDEF)-like protein